VTLVRAVDPPARALGIGPRGWIDLLAPAAEIAKTIAPTEFVPRGLRHNVPAVTAAILYGDEIGLGPLASVNGIHVIEGRVFVAAEAQRALVLAAGHSIWPVELGTTRCAWAGRRAGADEVTTVVWSLDDARRANLAGKPNYRAYPRQMLSARASAELVRAIFADVVNGIGAIEEYDDDVPGVDADGAGIAPARPRSTRRRRGTAAAVTDSTAAGSEARPAGSLPPLPPLPGESLGGTDERDAAGTGANVGPELLTAGQLRRIQQLMRERGIGSRSERLELAVEIIGRTISSSKELTTVEADRVIGYLEHADDGPADEPPEPVDDAQPDDDERGPEPLGLDV
jgi:hypothetical protein